MSVASELEKLAGLLREGLVTREEFDEQKRVLMSNATNASNPSLGADSSPSIGKSLGAYNILGMVGRGGMGVVYRARHRSSQIASRQGGDVALKVLHAQYSQDPTFQERFEREATLGLKLDHAGIVKVHDLIVDGDSLALAMDLVKGQELSDLIGKVRGPLPWREALAMFDGLLDAVSHAHSEGVIHRDLKPENIMVCEGGGLKVLDFGIARDESSGKTKTGTGMGTVDYMAPEQYTDASKVDARADIYALGMTLYEMVAGRLPWAANATEFEVLNTKAAGNIPSPTRFYPDIPPELVSVIEQAMDVDLGRRCQSADAFRRALQAVAEGGDAPVTIAIPEPTQEVAQQSVPVVLEANKGSAWLWVSLVALTVFGVIVFNMSEEQISPQESNDSYGVATVKGPQEVPPSWGIFVAEGLTQEGAKAEMDKYKRYGFDASYLWIPDYASLSGEQYWATYVGPVTLSDMQSAQRLLREVRLIKPGGYGKKIAQTGSERLSPRQAPSVPQYSTAEPSFRCDKAQTELEVFLCTDVEAATLDKAMGVLYRKGKKILPADLKQAVMKSQVTWIKTVQKPCIKRVTMKECLIQATSDRINIIESYLGPWL